MLSSDSRCVHLMGLYYYSSNVFFSSCLVSWIRVLNFDWCSSMFSNSCDTGLRDFPFGTTDAIFLIFCLAQQATGYASKAYFAVDLEIHHRKLESSKQSQIHHCDMFHGQASILTHRRHKLNKKECCSPDILMAQNHLNVPSEQARCFTCESPEPLH